MKYSEFKKELLLLGFEYVHDKRYDEIHAKNKSGRTVVSAPDDGFVYIDCEYDAFHALERYKKEQLLTLFARLVATPPEEREDEKRYRLRVHLPGIDRLGKLYMVEDKQTKKRILDGFFDSDGFKGIFTETELKDIDETGFTREEVTEWENQC